MMDPLWCGEAIGGNYDRPGKNLSAAVGCYLLVTKRAMAFARGAPKKSHREGGIKCAPGEGLAAWGIPGSGLLFDEQPLQFVERLGRYRGTLRSRGKQSVERAGKRTADEKSLFIHTGFLRQRRAVHN